MGNPQVLPQLPPIDPMDGPAAIYNLAWWVQRFIQSFPNAVGQAIDPTTSGQGASGDSSRSGSLSITEAPSGISYATDTQGNDTSGSIKGYIDVTFTLPARAIGANIYFKENGAANEQVLFFTTSPARILGLKVGISYDVRLCGTAANGSEGTFSGTTTTAVSASMSSAPSAPAGVAATGYPQAIIISWTAHSDATVKSYDVQRADDAGFTVNSVTIVQACRTNFFVDQFAGQAIQRYYKVKARRDTGQLSAFSSAVNATTSGTDTGELVTGAVTGQESASSAGPFSVGAGAEDSVEDVTIVVTQGICIIFAFCTVALSAAETAIVRIRRDDENGSILGGPVTINGPTAGTSVVALDSSPSGSEVYALCVELPGASRNVTDMFIMALNTKV